MSRIWPADDAHIARATERMRQGLLVGMPTETVYGLAADAANGEAVARVFAEKARPSFNPLIAHVTGADGAARLAQLDARADALMTAFWPGPLTIVLPIAADAAIADLALAGLGTIALRAPNHAVAQALLAAFGGALVAPSANQSGRISPTRPEHVVDELPNIPVLDGGPCRIGLESTIIGLADEVPRLLREGAVCRGEIEAVLGERLGRPGVGIEAPGMTTSHYAPTVRVRLDAADIRGREALLGFGGTPGAALDLSQTGDLNEAAANLFEMLRRLDAAGADIAVAPIPHTGLGAAINDRLRRAAAPRPENARSL